jgi:hypothetical protein
MMKITEILGTRSCADMKALMQKDFHEKRPLNSTYCYFIYCRGRGNADSLKDIQKHLSYEILMWFSFVIFNLYRINFKPETFD